MLSVLAFNFHCSMGLRRPLLHLTCCFHREKRGSKYKYRDPSFEYPNLGSKVSHQTKSCYETNS